MPSDIRLRLKDFSPKIYIAGQLGHLVGLGVVVVSSRMIDECFFRRSFFLAIGTNLSIRFKAVSPSRCSISELKKKI